MVEMRKSFWQKHRWLMGTLGVVLTVLVAVTVTLAVLARKAEPYLRARIVQALQDRFHSRVELDSFHVSLGNGLHGRWGVWAEGRGLRIWPPERLGTATVLEDMGTGNPLIQLDSFHFHVPFRYEKGKPVRISVVQLMGLNVDLPPRKHDPQADSASAGKPAPSHAGAKNHAANVMNGTNDAPQGTAPPKGPQAKLNQSVSSGMLTSFVIERIECDHAQLVLETDKPGKLPLGFDIVHLRLTQVTADGPMGFDAQLTNPRPAGLIRSQGSFGPWQADDPGESSISGDYRFEHADLGVFKGIAGILSSTGHYEGTLRNILVDGEADVPDFQLKHFGTPVQLHTKFHAKVDGTDGDTWLDPVDATLGRSHFTTSGRVVRFKDPAADADGPQPTTRAGRVSPFEGGHDIVLTVNVDRGHIDDFLRLAGHSSTPLLTGTVTTKASMDIPPGPKPVYERIKLGGAFMLSQAQFTSDKIQSRIQELSMRGQGRPKEAKSPDADKVQSHMEGNFQMAGGVIDLSRLEYSVPGALIQLKGTYGVDHGALNFEGSARMDATVSQMVGGWKGFLLKPADRLFKKDGVGAMIPIHVHGTRDAPEFGVDWGRLKSSSPETPGQKPQQEPQ